MKTASHKDLVMIAIFFWGYLFLSQSCTYRPESDFPNVVIIVADDLGWADLGCYGSSFYRTPHLDQMAAEGLLFTNGYASCPVCSPSRVSLMTGEYPVRANVTDWIKGRQARRVRPFEQMIGPDISYQLPLEKMTLAEYVKDQGYRTFFAGKWHMGDDEAFWPEFQGFDVNKGGYWAGSPRGKKGPFTGGFFTPYENPRLSDGPEGEYLTDRLTDETISFIKEKKESPFLAYLSFYTVHNPMQAHREDIARHEQRRETLGVGDKDRFRKDEDWMVHQNDWRQRTVQDHPVYASMVESMDSNIGRVFAALEEEGLEDNTLILFTSDNGGLSTSEGTPTHNGPLRGGKGWLYEGGIRVPFIMKIPGNYNTGQKVDVPVIGNDVMATVMDYINPLTATKSYLDGRSILPSLTDASEFQERPIFWHYPHYSNQGGRPGSAVRKGNYKLIWNHEDDSYQLFNLNDDISEKQDLQLSKIEKFEELKELLHGWCDRMEVKYPVPNPDYDPGWKLE